MVVHEIKSKEQWAQTLADNKIVMLDCAAEWCGPCKAISPILAKHSEDPQYASVYFAKIDVDELAETAAELGIKAMPTFIIFKDGEKAGNLVGANPPGLIELLNKSLL